LQNNCGWFDFEDRDGGWGRPSMYNFGAAVSAAGEGRGEMWFVWLFWTYTFIYDWLYNIDKSLKINDLRDIVHVHIFLFLAFVTSYADW